MARKKQLNELVAQLRAETGRSQSVSVGVAELDNLKEMIRRTQEVLYDDYDWPFLRVERTVTLANGQRYYDFPSDLNYDRIVEIRYKYNNVYTPLERGIDFDDYSIFDSTADERSSPALKWDVRNTGSTEQLEIWPIPNETNTIIFRGTKSLSSLVEENDRADLDDRLIVLFAAAEILARQKSSDAQAKLEQANNRLLILRRNSQSESRTIQMGLGNQAKDQSNRLKTRIIVS
jgi:hypothetical protein